MPRPDLTRSEAEARASVVAAPAYEVDLDLTGDGDTFRSTTLVRFRATPGATTFIESTTVEVHELVLNGRTLDAGEVGDGWRIRLDDLEAENELRVVSTRAYTNTGEGLHRFVDPVDDSVYLYTEFAVAEANRVYAVFDQPDLKASVRFTITAPADWQVLSNAPTPEAEPAAVEGTATWAFETGPVISSYIVAIIAGPYAAWHGTARSVDGRDVPLGLFTRASLAQYAEPEVMFGTVQAGLAFYEQAFGVPYPYGKYDQVFVPEYNWGAMENVGAVTFNESYLFRARVSDARREQRAIVVLHELSHMWFGNSVTMQWWNDLWLNESFATWASTLATSEVTEFTGVWATFASDEKTHAAEQDQLPSTHPIVAEIRDLGDVEVNFDAITYDKGASVLKQLVAWVGLEAFQRGVGAYLTAHSGGNATLRDLLDELERASGRELTRWSELWLETAGVNTLRAVVETDAAGTITARPRRAGRGPVAPDPPAAPPRHRLLLERRRRRARAHPSRGARRRRRVDRRARTRGPSAPRPAPRERRRPHLRQGAARCASRSTRPSAGSPSSPIPWPARSCSGRRGTPCATPSCPRATTCDSCSAASATRPSPPPAGSHSAGSSSPSAGTSPTITASGWPPRPAMPSGRSPSSPRRAPTRSCSS